MNKERESPVTINTSQNLNNSLSLYLFKRNWVMIGFTYSFIYVKIFVFEGCAYVDKDDFD